MADGFFEPAAAKANRAHAEYKIERSGFSDDPVSPAKLSIDIESCSVTGDTAQIRAIVKTGTTPHGAGSLAIATIVTRTVGVVMERQGGRWVVADEKVVSKDVSTYEDRKDSQLDR